MFKSQFGTDDWEMAEEPVATGQPNIVVNSALYLELLREAKILWYLQKVKVVTKYDLQLAEEAIKDKKDDG